MIKILKPHCLKFLVSLCLLAVSPLQAKTPIDSIAEHTSSSLCFFTPPQGWEIADPRQLSPHVKVAFLKNTGTGFRPSINLAVEETSVSMHEYLKAVKGIHEQDRNNRWRALGKVKTQAGLAQLTEIDSKTEWGPIRILQLIFLKDGHAYVITASALREDFSTYYQEIQATFRSMTLSSDLLSNIPQTDRRDMLKTKQHQLFQAAEAALQSPSVPKNLFEDPKFQKEHWLPFQETVVNSFGDMGAFWQVLLLKGTQEKLHYLISDVSLNSKTEEPQ